MTLRELVSKCAKEKVFISIYSTESGFSNIFFIKRLPNGDRRQVELVFDVEDFLLPGGELEFDLRIEECLNTLRREYDHAFLCKDTEEKHD